MRIRAVIDIDVDFDIYDGGINESELNIPAIKDAVENCVISDDLTELLVADITDAAGWSVTGVSVALERPIILSEGRVLE